MGIMVPSPFVFLRTLALLSLGTVLLSGAPAPASGPLKVFLLAGVANRQDNGIIGKTSGLIASNRMGDNRALSTPDGKNTTIVENAPLALNGQPNTRVVYTRRLYFAFDSSPENAPTRRNQNGKSPLCIGSSMRTRMIQLRSPVPNPPPGSPPAAGYSRHSLFYVILFVFPVAHFVTHGYQ